MSLAEQVYRLSQSLPPEERYGMCSQMRRAAISVPANIAEGWARGTTQQFLQFLSIAAGSLWELETYLILAQRVELLPPPSVLL
ncbi:MAG: four helix bundle protein, partial [Candidatus Kapabacteria bacterium]|nr:four helix bundle protein [Candidatus Kapabacteria bacterium]